ncbi:hypothetical protein ACJENI_24690 [Escherichia coli]|uniref:hypothetical protein n=1 Tax=uncultured Sphingomonas sp. TaxID=158754 RepID=UPI0030FCAA8D
MLAMIVSAGALVAVRPDPVDMAAHTATAETGPLGETDVPYRWEYPGLARY